MTSLTRSALVRVAASRCWRCRRILRYPSSAKITNKLVSSHEISFVLRLCARCGHRPRVVLVSGMLQHRGDRHRTRFSLKWPRRRMFFLREYRQVLHRDSEQSKTCRDDRERDHELSPLGHVVMSDPGFEAGHADVQSIGNKTKQTRNCGKVQTIGGVANLFKAQQGNGKDESQRQFNPQKICFVAGLEDVGQLSAMEKVFKAEQRIDAEHN